MLASSPASIFIYHPQNEPMEAQYYAVNGQDHNRSGSMLWTQTSKMLWMEWPANQRRWNPKPIVKWQFQTRAFRRHHPVDQRLKNTESHTCKRYWPHQTDVGFLGLYKATAASQKHQDRASHPGAPFVWDGLSVDTPQKSDCVPKLSEKLSIAMMPS